MTRRPHSSDRRPGTLTLTAAESRRATRRRWLFGVAAAGTACALAACAQGGSTSGTSRAPSTAAANAGAGSHWTDYGATACDTYLTPEVVAQILTNPEGRSRKLSAQACTYESADHGGSITITLTSAGPDAFDHYQQYLVNPVPLPGVGDKASRSMIGIDAVKGNDRTCTIDAGGAPGSTRLRGEALAQHLGAICNKLFALQ
jgi:hypothetical protein